MTKKTTKYYTVEYLDSVRHQDIREITTDLRDYQPLTPRAKVTLTLLLAEKMKRNQQEASV